MTNVHKLAKLKGFSKFVCMHANVKIDHSRETFQICYTFHVFTKKYSLSDGIIVQDV